LNEKTKGMDNSAELAVKTKQRTPAKKRTHPHPTITRPSPYPCPKGKVARSGASLHVSGAALKDSQERASIKRLAAREGKAVKFSAKEIVRPPKSGGLFIL
jgi:hypothetical protein